VRHSLGRDKHARLSGALGDARPHGNIIIALDSCSLRKYQTNKAPFSMGARTPKREFRTDARSSPDKKVN
jgi:hypothetical protein